MLLFWQTWDPESAIVPAIAVRDIVTSFHMLLLVGVIHLKDLIHMNNFIVGSLAATLLLRDARLENAPGFLRL